MATTPTSLVKPPTAMSKNTSATNATRKSSNHTHEAQGYVAFPYFNCSDNTTYCKPNSGLRSVPREDIPDSTTVIDLRNNSMTSLNQSSFVGLNNVTTMLLSNNNISEIAPLTFQDQQKLTILDLAYNEIKLVNGDAWYDNKKLKILRLTGNPIENLTSDAFSNLSSLLVIDPPMFICHRPNILAALTTNEVALEVKGHIRCDESNCRLKRLENEGKLQITSWENNILHRPKCTNIDKYFDQMDLADMNCTGKVTYH